MPVTVVDDHADLICARVENVLILPTDGTRGACSTCNEPVWVSPSAQARVEAGERLLCVPCLWARLRA